MDSVQSANLITFADHPINTLILKLPFSFDDNETNTTYPCLRHCATQYSKATMLAHPHYNLKMTQNWGGKVGFVVKRKTQHHAKKSCQHRNRNPFRHNATCPITDKRIKKAAPNCIMRISPRVQPYKAWLTVSIMHYLPILHTNKFD